MNANSRSKSLLRSAALASGLLNEAQIDEAWTAAYAQDAPPAADEAPKTIDQKLADALVTFGHINRWQAEQLLRGRTKFNLNSYRILDSIGQGGMGQVFKAEHTVMRRIVAIKVLPRHKSTPEAISNFCREIETQAQLDHKNLVRAFDAGQDGNVHYLVTEYVPGTDLRRLIRGGGRLDLRTAAAIITQVAEGLEYAHSKGLIHRDVKPGNVLVTPEGLTKVSDLGLASFLETLDSGDPRAGKIVGTADYLSPEQITSPVSITPASDIYSLGCTLYYAVTGKVPFPGGTTREKAAAHCTQQPIDPRRVTNAELSDAFVDVIAHMMAKEVGQRVQTARHVIELLQPFVDESQGPPALPREGTLPPVRPTLADTVAMYLGQHEIDDGQLESASQISDGTYPISAAGEETIPLAEIVEPSLSVREPVLPPLVVVLILIGSFAAIIALGAILARVL